MLLHVHTINIYMVSENIFKGSPIISLWKLLIPRVWSVLTRGA